MKIHLTILLAFIFSLAGHSQTSFINGCVRDSVGNVMKDATVLVFKSDSLEAGIVTDKKGCFTLRLDTGNYTLHITRLGFLEYVGSVALTSSTGKSLPTIVLKEAPYELGEVTVTDKNFEAELNKSIFKISSRVKKSAIDALQVLSSVPALLVNPYEKSVTIAGAGSSIVMVNNIRRNSNYLLVIQPENIERVEIIRSPGARYRDVDGIINVVTKAPVNGQSGHVKGEGDPLLQYGMFTGNYTYVADKLSVSVNGQDFLFDENNDKYSLTRDIYSGSETIHTERDSKESRFTMNSVYVSADIDYVASPQTYISLRPYYIASPQRQNRVSEGIVSSNLGNGYALETIEKQHGDYKRYGTEAYYQTQLNSVWSGNVDFNYESTATNGNNSYKEMNDGNFAYENIQESHNRNQSMNMQVNLQQKLKNVQFEDGYRLYWQNYDFENTMNSTLNRTEHDEWRNYLYANALGKINKRFSYQLGVGFDWVKTILSNGLGGTHSNLMPNAMLRYLVNDAQNITLDYRMARQSPSSRMLNPIPVYLDSVRIVTGNSNLSPFYTNRIRLAYERSKGKLYMYASLQYYQANNSIVSSTYSEGGKYHITYANADRYSQTSIYLNASLNVFNWWKVMANASLNHHSYSDANQKQFNKKFLSPTLGLQSMVNYNRLFAYLHFPVNFRTPTLTGYSFVTYESWFNASYRLNKGWSVTAGIRYLSPVIYKNETYTEQLSEVYNDHKTTRYFRFLIGIQYNFQKGKQKNYKQKNIQEYDDEINIETKIY
jgi:hypothetical protein